MNLRRRDEWTGARLWYHQAAMLGEIFAFASLSAGGASNATSRPAADAAGCVVIIPDDGRKRDYNA